jgi:hypothetical protein
MPGAGDEDYPPTVFDESFVRAARLQEYSAQERLEEHTTPVRSRPPEPPPPGVRVLPKQGIALALIILVAFAAAIYLGGNTPYPTGATGSVDPPVSTVVPLAPAEEVPGSQDTDRLFAAGPAADFGVGAGGVRLPDPRATAHFSREQVLTSLTLAKEYLEASALTPEVLTGEAYAPVRELLGPEQLNQFDRALAGTDSSTTVTSWIVRFDPEEIALADPVPRVDGEFTFTEISEDLLQVTGTHTIAYALRPAGAPGAPASLFTVQRETRLLFTDQSLRERQVGLRGSETMAGPMDCAAQTADTLEPLLAGEEASAHPSGGVDPYAPPEERLPVCGTLSANALPDPAAR